MVIVRWQNYNIPVSHPKRPAKSYILRSLTMLQHPRSSQCTVDVRLNTCCMGPHLPLILCLSILARSRVKLESQTPPLAHG